MSTHVQRAWDVLRERIDEPSYAGVNALREWMTGDLLRVSARVPELLEASCKSPAWGYLLSAPVATFAIRAAAWDEFASKLSAAPPSYDPVQVFAWAQSALWKLCVFVDPDDACDNDQFDLELWWSERHQEAAFVCGLGDYWAFRRRSSRGALKPHEPWALDKADLLPASRSIAVARYPDVSLLKAQS